MKNKKKVKSLKLNLNKVKIAELKQEDLNQIKGGWTHGFASRCNCVE